ncbi:MAG: hypothetical protein WCH04_16820 [Gammaproteobacteria bacterium]
MSMTRVQQRLLMYTSKNSESGCWGWTGQISSSGYGRFKIEDGHGALCMQSAQHISYEAFIGLVASGAGNANLQKQALHYPRTPRGVRPRFLMASPFRGSCALSDAAVTGLVTAAVKPVPVFEEGVN